MQMILKGNSATGKTTLVEMIRSYNENGIDSVITVECDKKCEVLSSIRWKETIGMIKDLFSFTTKKQKLRFPKHRKSQLLLFLISFTIFNFI